MSGTEAERSLHDDFELRDWVTIALAVAAALLVVLAIVGILFPSLIV